MELLISAFEGSTTKVQLSKAALSLGRSADNDLAYPDDPWLSRFHLTISQQDGIWWVKDCDSRNGTVLNAGQVKSAQRIKAGDRIRAGHLTIDVCEVRHQVQRPVISFVPEEEERSTREATIITSLDKLLSQTGGAPSPAVGTFNSGRIIGALLKAGQELAGHRPLEALFDVILNLSLSAVDAKRGVILTLEDHRSLDLKVRASKGDGFSISTSVRDRVINGRTSLVLSDAQRDDALRRQDSILMHQVRSMMAVPLQTGDRVIGLIYVDNGSVIRHFSQEDLDLLTVMSNVAAIRIEHARLAEIEQSEKLMELQLAQASDIQQTLLPSAAPIFEGFDLAGLNISCQTVGGDYYDFLPYQDGRLGLVVGDVSGKGYPAALMMSSLQARVQMLRETMPQPDQAVSLLNRNICERCPMGKFITFFYGLLDPSGGFEYSNAGHNYPLLLRANGQVELLRGNGLVMGLFPSVFYPLKSTRLEPGDLLALYSDGVTEASREGGPEFGEEGLSELLQKFRHLPCEDLAQRLMEHVRTFCGTPSFNDDFTILLAKRH